MEYAYTNINNKCAIFISKPLYFYKFNSYLYYKNILRNMYVSNTIIHLKSIIKYY